jgi:hypothetical protein
MLKMLNWKIDLSKCGFIAVFSLGLCLLVLQLGCNTSPPNPNATPTPPPSATGQLSGQFNKDMRDINEKKLTASGIDSLYIERDYVVSPTPAPSGTFIRPAPNSDSESLAGQIKTIDVYDDNGKQRISINCQGDNKCQVLIEGQNGKNVTIEDGTLAGDEGKVFLRYDKSGGPSEHRDSPRKKWGFLKNLKIANIKLFVDSAPVYSFACPANSPFCSVDVTYTY